ncbi:hypothetical protein FHR83_004241 [Actinoplanes campanulatus]|uniref:Uncharacterized protein n=1 Tax=Actinoplanes campanulatus TaxID=113559 RepID=A0A7W5FFN9_9ACTN|nr:hypothetical protein [Actinoplanes campanulatus]MBB3096567.1 hypothetical protein [Actinoplanes campanulatus]GGN29900.1 hypothetical protein GCM10010109_49190 [Actinoplanes campanulatus]
MNTAGPRGPARFGRAAQPDRVTCRGATVAYQAGISALWRTKTVEGIGFNSSYGEVLEAYPDFAMVFGGNAEFAYGEVDVPGNRDATYDIRVQQGLVDRIDLDMRGEACYKVAALWAYPEKGPS